MSLFVLQLSGFPTAVVRKVSTHFSVCSHFDAETIGTFCFGFSTLSGIQFHIQFFAVKYFHHVKFKRHIVSMMDIFGVDKSVLPIFLCLYLQSENIGSLGKK